MLIGASFHPLITGAVIAGILATPMLPMNIESFHPLITGAVIAGYETGGWSMSCEAGFHPLITGAVIAGAFVAAKLNEMTSVFPSPHYRGCDRGKARHETMKLFIHTSFHPLITGAVIAGRRVRAYGFSSREEVSIPSLPGL